MGEKKNAVFATGRFTFGKNLISNFALIAVAIGIGFWFVPYLVRELGAVRYGYLPLAANVVMLFSILTNSYSVVVGRDLTLAIKEDQSDTIQKVFCTSLFAALALGGLLLIPALALANWTGVFLRVPGEISSEVRGFFALVAFSFLLTTASTAFQSMTLATNRLDLHNGVSLSHRLTRISVTIALFIWVSPTLITAGWGLLTAGVIELTGHVLCWRKLGATINISRGSFDQKILHGMIHRCGWIVLATLGAFLFVGADMILSNRLLGPKATTDYALAVQWAVLLRLFASALSGLFVPTTFRMSSSVESDEMCEHIQRAMKFVGFPTAIGAGVLCGFAEPFLNLWLGSDFGRLAPIILILIAPMGVLCAAIPMFSVAVGANKMRIPSLAITGLGVLNIGLIFLLAQGLDWGIAGIAAAVTFSGFLLYVIFTPIYTALILNVKRSRLFSGIAKVTMATLIFWSISDWANSQFDPDSWLKLSMITIALGGLFALATVFLGLNQHDRLALKKWLTSSQ